MTYLDQLKDYVQTSISSRHTSVLYTVEQNEDDEVIENQESEVSNKFAHNESSQDVLQIEDLFPFGEKKFEEIKCEEIGQPKGEFEMLGFIKEEISCEGNIWIHLHKIEQN